VTPGSDGNVLDALGQLSADDLLRFLNRQRWFGAKGGDPSNARIRDAVVLPWGGGAMAIARVDVGTTSGTQTFQLPVATRPAPFDDADAVIAQQGNAVLVDATRLEAFRLGLGEAAAYGARAETNGLRWVAEPAGEGSMTAEVASPVCLVPPLTSRLSSAEQSNTSIVFDDSSILKLFRTLQAGVQPDVEMTHFLTTRAGFANTPRLLATFRFERDGEVTTAGMVQRFLPNSSDAWSYALSRGERYFTAPRGTDAPNDFTADARRLGAITRAMHDALASNEDEPDFAPEPVDPDDLDMLVARVQQQIRDGLKLLELQITNGTLPKERTAEAGALVRRQDHYLGWVNELDDSLTDDAGMKIRTHGDYHLGQVLRTVSGDFMIIDFEGEPARPLAERREKTSPLRDVAGMLRSFAYAAATLGMQSEKRLDPATRELRIARWERDVRAAFLAGYLESGERDEADYLPEEQTHVRQLIALFETEKAFYELAYELNNRPAWAWIPMRGISKLLVIPASER
jgi:trehalose synthase-fused probable maltokinase